MSSKKQLEREKLLKKIAEKRARLETSGDIQIKVPRISLPSDYNIQSQPLFSLPAELMRPILASGYPGYAKDLAKAEKKGTKPLKLPKKLIPFFLAAEEAAQQKSYTALRRQREEFRKRLVDLIVSKDEEMNIDADEIPSASEREVLRYYYYIRHGVDTVHVAPLDQRLLDNVSVK